MGSGAMDGPGEGTWSVFAAKVVEERDAALARVSAAEGERDVARKSEMSARTEVERLTRECNDSVDHFSRVLSREQEHERELRAELAGRDDEVARLTRERDDARSAYAAQRDRLMRERAELAEARAGFERTTRTAEREANALRAEVAASAERERDAARAEVERVTKLRDMHARNADALIREVATLRAQVERVREAWESFKRGETMQTLVWSSAYDALESAINTVTSVHEHDAAVARAEQAERALAERTLERDAARAEVATLRAQIEKVREAWDAYYDGTYLGNDRTSPWGRLRAAVAALAPPQSAPIDPAEAARTRGVPYPRLSPASHEPAPVKHAPECQGGDCVCQTVPVASKPTQRERMIACLCLCHDTEGAVHDHHGKPCACKSEPTLESVAGEMAAHRGYTRWQCVALLREEASIGGRAVVWDSWHEPLRSRMRQIVAQLREPAWSADETTISEAGP